MALFDPLAASFGGVLIGLASVMLMLFTGHIAVVPDDSRCAAASYRLNK